MHNKKLIFLTALAFIVVLLILFVPVRIRPGNIGGHEPAPGKNSSNMVKDIGKTAEKQPAGYSESAGLQKNNMNSRENKPVTRSVRIDLSSLEAPGSENEAEKMSETMIGRIKKSGLNAVYLSPWSDGYANYRSRAAEPGGFGRYAFFEKLTEEARKAGVRAFAWFVAGKDNFPAEKHPDWYAVGQNGSRYDHEDEPGLFLPFASLANDDYVDYHLRLVREVNALDIDGWVISEPLIGWGDIYDDYYTDFSDNAAGKFKVAHGFDPELLLDESSPYYFEDNPAAYADWVDFRASIVSNFVARTVGAIREVPGRTVIITVFTEPGPDGSLKSFSELKEWLGEDIQALAALKPDYIEIQSLYQDFEYPQTPVWTGNMLRQFRDQAGPSAPPTLVSVQGWDVSPDNLAASISSALSAGASGISFYAYHTIDDLHWGRLAEVWVTDK